MSSNQLNKSYVSWGKRLIWVGVASYVLVIWSLFHDGLISFNPKVDLSESIDWDLMSKVGGLIGGIITPIWTLISGLFLYQTLVFSKETIDTQAKQSKIQQFENTLMNMLQRQDRIKNEIQFKLTDTFVWLKSNSNLITNSVISGEAFFRDSAQTFNLWYKENNRLEHGIDICFNPALSDADVTKFKSNAPSWDAWLARIEFKGGVFYTYYQLYFDYYFGHLEAIFQLIEKGNEDEIFKVENDHHPYIKFFKAQLSSSELFHIYYGTLSYYPSLTPFLIKYGILEKLAQKELVDPQQHQKIS